MFKYKSAKNAQTVKPIGKVDGTQLGQQSHKALAMVQALSEQLNNAAFPLTEEESDLLHGLRNEIYQIDNILRGYQVNPAGDD